MNKILNYRNFSRKNGAGASENIERENLVTVEAMVMQEQSRFFTFFLPFEAVVAWLFFL
jgi:hypothetical protein